MVPNAVENQIVTLVVTLPAFSEILPSIVNDLLCADGSHHLHISRAAYAGHIRADLHRERTHASRRTVNQDLVLRLNLSLVAQAAQPKTLQCGECRNRHRSRLLKRHVIGLHDHSRLGGTHILVPANRLDLAGHIMAYSCLLWFAQASHYANHVRRASEEQVSWIEGSRPDFYQDFIVPSGRLFNLFTLEDIGWTVAVVDDCFHVNCCQDLLDRYQWLHLCALNQEPQHNPQFPRLRDHRKSVRRHNQ